MCNYLDPACFMANVFTASSAENLDFGKLRSLRDRVTAEMADKEVIIDWTRDAVMSVFDFYPELFEKEGRTVHWKGCRAKEELKNSFDYGFEDDFIDRLWHTIQEASRQEVGVV